MRGKVITTAIDAGDISIIASPITRRYYANHASAIQWAWGEWVIWPIGASQ